MATYSFAGYAKALEQDGKAVERAVATIRRTVRLHGPRLFQAQVDSARPLPVDRGTYRRSLHVEDIPNGATMYNSAPHAGVIELGRRPGQRPPPLQAIIAWVFRKGLVKSSSRSFASNRQYAAARALAYVIARSIGRRGLPAHRILALASAELDKVVQREVTTALFGEGSGARPS